MYLYNFPHACSDIDAFITQNSKNTKQKTKQTKTTQTYVVGDSGTGLWQAHTLGGVKLVKGIQTIPLYNLISKDKQDLTK